LKQIFVASADQVKGSELVCFNPKILKKEGVVKEFEGCLSIPEFYEPVKRAKKVWIQAMTLAGEIVELKARPVVENIPARNRSFKRHSFRGPFGLVKASLPRKNFLKKQRESPIEVSIFWDK